MSPRNPHGGGARHELRRSEVPQGSSYEERLAGFVGRVLNERTPGADPVNVPMIRHWVEALDLTNPVHLDAEAAHATGRRDVVAPASMIQAWTMRGYAKTVRPAAAGEASSNAGFEALTDLLAEGGYTSVVATDSELDFVREVSPGEEITVEEVVDAIGPEKETGLGTGRFVTTIKTYRDAAGVTVATQRWRTLRFKPPVAAEAAPPRALRPRPALNLDNAFWFEAAQQHRLLIQRCASCQTLRHPVGPQCPHCQSFEWNTVEASGRGTLYSFTVAHHPKLPAFDYPLVIAVVELAEGTRVVANLVDIAPDEARIGMALELDWLDADPDLSLPIFRAPAPHSPEEN